VITTFYANDRVPVTTEQIASVMRRAMVAIEDARFYEHSGLDVRGTARAGDQRGGGLGTAGGSTLTQQLVKQTLAQTADTAEERQAATEGSLGRKLREARLALVLEEGYSKDEIPTRYLNTVYFGNGAYGVQAAAQRYFSVDAADLTLPQAAMLAGLVQSPANDNPLTDPAAARPRRNQVLQRMYELGYIDARRPAADRHPPQRLSARVAHRSGHGRPGGDGGRLPHSADAVGRGGRRVRAPEPASAACRGSSAAGSRWTTGFPRAPRSPGRQRRRRRGVPQPQPRAGQRTSGTRTGTAASRKAGVT
jgi:membrane peptidoglycan carboxypeptidase